MINILIRTSYRPVLFRRMLDSVYAQSFKNYRIIVSYDDERALSYIPEGIEKIRVYNNGQPLFFDWYCNTLKSMVTEGFFWFLDDDEYLADPKALEKIYRHLKGQSGVVCQLSRNGRLKPSNELIKGKRVVRSKIGTPCLFLHNSFKDIAGFDGSKGAADYWWIKAVSRNVRLKFVPIVVAYCDRRSNGAMEV